MPSLASLIVSWHIWALGLTLSQELLVQSKNTTEKLEATVPGTVEELGLSMFSKAGRGAGS
jgi:hypothetical protein